MMRIRWVWRPLRHNRSLDDVSNGVGPLVPDNGVEGLRCPMGGWSLLCLDAAADAQLGRPLITRHFATAVFIFAS